MEVIELKKEHFKKLKKHPYIRSQNAIYYKCDDDLYKIYYSPKRYLTKDNLQKIEVISFLGDNTPIVRPKKLIKLNDEIIGFTTWKHRHFVPIDYFRFDEETKLDLLHRIKEETLKLADMNIGFDKIDYENILFDGRNILFCGVPDNYTFNNTVKATKQALNNFTLAYLNDINQYDLYDKLESTLIKWFNREEYEELIGVTDNMECINFCYNLIFNEKVIIPDLIMDKIDKTKIKRK